MLNTFGFLLTEPSSIHIDRLAFCRCHAHFFSVKGVTDVLKSPELNVRRAAMEDITLAKHFPALDSVLVAPNSMVLKTRTTRSLLDSAIPTNEVSWDSELEQKLDQLIWDHPAGLDFLGVTADTAKARSLTRCVEICWVPVEQHR